MDRKRKPPTAAVALIAVSTEPANGALRKNLGSRTGSARRASYAANAARAAAATANSVTITGARQPNSGPSMIA